MKHRALMILYLVGVSACTAQTASGNRQRVIQYNTGTGFYVNDEGYVLTNYHVVRPCDKGYSVLSNKYEKPATLVAVDKEHDLALLKSGGRVTRAAVFNAMNVMPKPNDPLTIIGYPGNAWKDRIPVVGSAKLLAMRGPRGENFMLQFSDSVGQGNSGGPLLDNSGNVLGVIMAKATVTRINRATDKVESVTHTDVAIRPDTVWQFLDRYKVRYFRAPSAKPISHGQITQKAKQFIVNVRCPVD